MELDERPGEAPDAVDPYSYLVWRDGQLSPALPEEIARIKEVERTRRRELLALRRLPEWRRHEQRYARTAVLFALARPLRQTREMCEVWYRSAVDWAASRRGALHR